MRFITQILSFTHTHTRTRSLSHTHSLSLSLLYVNLFAFVSVCRARPASLSLSKTDFPSSRTKGSRLKETQPNKNGFGILQRFTCPGSNDASRILAGKRTIVGHRKRTVDRQRLLGETSRDLMLRSNRDQRTTCSRKVTIRKKLGRVPFSFQRLSDPCEE